MDNPVLIIGAGLSGLTVGRLLVNQGIPCIVFEAATPDRSEGFSISLREWGYKALLAALGDVPLRSMTRSVAPDRLRGGHGFVDLILRANATGKVLVAPDPQTQPAIVRANRNALRAWIAECGDAELDIRYGHQLERVEGTVGDVTAVFDNGARHHGCIVIAADGVHSSVRSQVLPHIAPEIVPVVVYHGEFSLSHADFDKLVRPLSGASNILAGVGDGFNTPITVSNITRDAVHLDWSYSRVARTDSNDVANSTVDPLFRPHATPEEARQIPQALLDELATRTLAEPWSLFLRPEVMQKHAVFYWVSRAVTVTRDDVDKAAEGGIVFVGDAWHAMPIFGGEGGCHALVDSVELAAVLAKVGLAAGQNDASTLHSAITQYYDGAWQRCQEAVRRSKGRFHVLHRPIAEWQDIAAKKVRTME